MKIADVPVKHQEVRDAIRFAKTFVLGEEERAMRMAFTDP